MRDSVANQTNAPTSQDDRPADRHGAAVRSLAEEVVARLSRSGGQHGTGPADVQAEVDRYCAALLEPDQERAVDLGLEAIRSGVDFDTLCETRLAPAARRLGELWEEDRLSFAEVTLAANRLFFVLRRLAPRARSPMSAKCAVFASPPGEEHLLGVTMAAERARALGWHVDLLLGEQHDTIVDRISAAQPEVVGIAVGSERTFLALSRLVVALRVAVPHVPIVLCGGDPKGVARARTIVGADAVAEGFPMALEEMNRLIAAAQPL